LRLWSKVSRATVCFFSYQPKNFRMILFHQSPTTQKILTKKSVIIRY
jgi:hypothetical protein